MSGVTKESIKSAFIDRQESLSIEDIDKIAKILLVCTKKNYTVYQPAIQMEKPKVRRSIPGVGMEPVIECPINHVLKEHQKQRRKTNFYCCENNPSEATLKAAQDKAKETDKALYNPSERTSWELMAKLESKPLSTKKGKGKGKKVFAMMAIYSRTFDVDITEIKKSIIAQLDKKVSIAQLSELGGILLDTISYKKILKNYINNPLLMELHNHFIQDLHKTRQSIDMIMGTITSLSKKIPGGIKYYDKLMTELHDKPLFYYSLMKYICYIYYNDSSRLESKYAELADETVWETEGIDQNFSDLLILPEEAIIDLENIINMTQELRNTALNGKPYLYLKPCNNMLLISMLYMEYTNLYSHSNISMKYAEFLNYMIEYSYVMEHPIYSYFYDTHKGRLHEFDERARRGQFGGASSDEFLVKIKDYCKAVVPFINLTILDRDGLFEEFITENNEDISRLDVDSYEMIEFLFSKESKIVEILKLAGIDISHYEKLHEVTTASTASTDNEIIHSSFRDQDGDDDLYKLIKASMNYLAKNQADIIKGAFTYRFITFAVHGIDHETVTENLVDYEKNISNSGVDINTHMLHIVHDHINYIVFVKDGYLMKYNYIMFKEEELEGEDYGMLALITDISQGDMVRDPVRFFNEVLQKDGVRILEKPHSLRTAESLKVKEYADQMVRLFGGEEEIMQVARELKTAVDDGSPLKLVNMVVSAFRRHREYMDRMWQNSREYIRLLGSVDNEACDNPNLKETSRVEDVAMVYQSTCLQKAVLLASVTGRFMGNHYVKWQSSRTEGVLRDPSNYVDTGFGYMGLGFKRRFITQNPWDMSESKLPFRSSYMEWNNILINGPGAEKNITLYRGLNLGTINKTGGTDTEPEYSIIPNTGPGTKIVYNQTNINHPEPFQCTLLPEMAESFPQFGGGKDNSCCVLAIQIPKGYPILFGTKDFMKKKGDGTYEMVRNQLWQNDSDPYHLSKGVQFEVQMPASRLIVSKVTRSTKKGRVEDPGIFMRTTHKKTPGALELGSKTGSEYKPIGKSTIGYRRDPKLTGRQTQMAINKIYVIVCKPELLYTLINESKYITSTKLSDIQNIMKETDLRKNYKLRDSFTSVNVMGRRYNFTTVHLESNSGRRIRIIDSVPTDSSLVNIIYDLWDQQKLLVYPTDPASWSITNMLSLKHEDMDIDKYIKWRWFTVLNMDLIEQMLKLTRTHVDMDTINHELTEIRETKFSAGAKQHKVLTLSQVDPDDQYF